MPVLFVSVFRDAPEHQINRWYSQLKPALEGSDNLALAVEGDSARRTCLDHLRRIAAENKSIKLSNFNHGGPKFGSVESPQRMAQLSKLLNHWLDTSTTIIEDYGTDVLIYVESDLIWQWSTLRPLADLVHSRDATIAAPMTFAGKNFYDVWAFRKNGVRFSPSYPYHSDFYPGVFNKVDSVGSCVIMPASAATNVRAHDDNAFVGWCDEARRQGYLIVTNDKYRIDHPVPGQ